MVNDYDLNGGKYIVKDVVSCYDVDMGLRLRPVAFMNIAQEMATRAADVLGFGYDDMKRRNMAWVLSRMHFRFVDIPCWKDELVVSTWHKGISGPFFVRDFSACAADGSPKVLGTSLWVVLDTEKRSMVRIQDIEEMIDKDSGCYEDAIAQQAPKVMMPRRVEPRLVGSVRLGYSDTDFNGHTNNACYIQHAMNCFDLSEIKDMSVSDVFVTFSHETYPNEQLDLYMYDEPVDGQMLSSNGKAVRRSSLIEGKVGDRQAFCSRIVFV